MYLSGGLVDRLGSMETNAPNVVLAATETVIAVVSPRGVSRRFKVREVPAGRSGRKVDGGPLVPGPWAYAFELCTYVADCGSSGADSERLTRDGIEHVYTDGMRIAFPTGTTYAATVLNGYLRLELAR